MQTKVVPPVVRRRGGGDSQGFWGREEGDGVSPAPVDSWRLGLWLLLAALTMMFGALISAYLFRLPEKARFPFEPPSILWVNTVVLLVSSGSCQWAVRSVRGGNQRGLLLGLTATLFLGLLFVAGQLYGWYQLVQAGVYAQKNVFSGFFYVMTATHGVHLLVGVLVLLYLWARALQRHYHAEYYLPVELGTLYWHYLDFVWLWLFVLLRFIG